MPELTPDQVEGSISGDEAKLYRLIWSRFMASQMADCLMDTVSANITAGDYIFRASGFHVTFDGFTALYEEATDDKQKKETALPPLEVSQDLKLNKLSAEQKFTQPPPYYTEATLIHALEETVLAALPPMRRSLPPLWTAAMWKRSRKSSKPPRWAAR